MIEAYITGVNGFIGTHLKEKLGKPTSIPHEKIQTTKLEPFNCFYFLSAYGNMAFQTEDDKIIQANVLDPVHAITEAHRLGFKSFVFMSTSSVKLERQTMYSRTKKATEEVLLAFAEKHHLPICIIRPYSVTGVGEQKEHLIPTLIRSCLKGEPMSFVAEPTHDFIDVDDVVNGILSLSKNGARGIFELGSGKIYTNQQVLEIVEKTTGKKAKVNRISMLRDYDNDHWQSTNFRARGFGWLPTKTLEQSITEMVKAYAVK